MSSELKILIMDDEPRICNSLELLLSRHNYYIQTANDVKSAIDFISKESFDLILTDIVMDDSDGFEVIDYINRQKIDMVVVMMTGRLYFVVSSSNPPANPPMDGETALERMPPINSAKRSPFVISTPASW